MTFLFGGLNKAAGPQCSTKKKKATFDISFHRPALNALKWVLSIVSPHLSSVVASRPPPLALLLSAISRYVYQSNRPPLHPRPWQLLIRTFVITAGLGGVQTSDQIFALTHDEWVHHCILVQTTLTLPMLFELPLEVLYWAEFMMLPKGSHFKWRALVWSRKLTAICCCRVALPPEDGNILKWVWMNCECRDVLAWMTCIFIPLGKRGSMWDHTGN